MAFALLFALAAGQGPTTIPWNLSETDGLLNEDGRLVFSDAVFNKRARIIRLVDPKLPSSRFVIKTFAGAMIFSSSSIQLEMTVVLRTGDSFVVRTLDTGGPMAPIIGRRGNDVQSVGHDFELPFVSDPSNPPKEIMIDLIGEGAGLVAFSPLTVEPWPRWSLTWLAAGGFAAALGVVLGMIGGLYGLLAAVPTSRRAAFFIGKLVVILGFLMTIGSGVLYFTSWPFGIWLPVGIGGLVVILAFGGTLPMVKKGIESADRMAASADPSLEPA